MFSLFIFTIGHPDDVSLDYRHWHCSTPLSTGQPLISIVFRFQRTIQKNSISSHFCFVFFFTLIIDDS